MEEKQDKKGLSYEQLNQVATQLSQQNQDMYRKIQELTNTNLFKRLDYLFKILEFSKYFPEEFTKASVEEIVDLMTIPEESDIKKDGEE